ncbi:hypothetical protein C0V77_11920 [Emticicia sp. TH156]|nr:hypothetical protein C0V77_11920 [Emticicia sp. TH156]
MQPAKTVTYGRFSWLNQTPGHCFYPFYRFFPHPTQALFFLPVSKISFPAILYRKPGEIYQSNHFCYLPLHLLKIDNERLKTELLLYIPFQKT